MDILLLESEPGLLTMLRGVLESRGHAVTVAADGDAGVKIFQKQDFPIVIDGLETCRDIRASQKGADCLILALIAGKSPEHLEQILEAGADDCLSKPIDPDEFHMRLRVAEQRANTGIRRRATEAARRVAEADAQSLFRLVRNANSTRIFWKDLQSRYLGCNQQFASDAGLQDPEQIIGKTDHDLYQTEQAVLSISDDIDVMRSGLSKYRCEQRRHPDGGSMYIETRKSTLKDGNGKLIGVLGTAQDITERKLAEEAIRKEQEKYHALFDVISDPIVNVDLETGRFFQVNRAACTHLGYSEEELLQMGPEDIDIPGFGAKVPDRIKALQEKGQLIFETAHRRKDGVVIPVEMNVRIVDFDERHAAIAVARDITTRKRAEREILAAKNLAEQANQAKSVFLSRMGHELRTPLNAIMGFAQIMQMSEDDETITMHRDNLDVMIRSGKLLVRIIDDLLNLSAIEARRVILQIKKIDLGGILAECCALMSPLTTEHRIELHATDEAWKNLMVYADAFRLKQVLINLLANAIKYNRHGGSVKISGQRTAEKIRILISDTGQGIPTESLDSLFQPFSGLAQRPYHIEGAGIGLSIAKQLMDLMGGTIGVESEFGKGSTFWIELKIANTQAPPTARPGNAANENGNQEPGSAASLLYIEDNPTHIQLVKALIAKMSGRLTLHCAHTSTLGLDLARAHKPDVILMDLCLPGMHGFELFKLLQRDERTCNIPVIAISASINPDDIEAGLNLGFKRYLTKPLDLVEFTQALNELLMDQINSPVAVPLPESSS